LDILRQTLARAQQTFDLLHLQTVAIITTQARVLGHLGRPFEAVETMAEAIHRMERWDIAEDYPYYVEAKKRHAILLRKAARAMRR
jgi:hypothetical protein